MIKKSSDFTRVMKKGKWFSGDFMTMYVMKNDGSKWRTMCAATKVNSIVDFQNLNRLGIAVSKKFSKSSVKRNRVKRLIKESYRLQENGILKGYSIVFLWKNHVEYDKVCFETISADLLKCMKKANLLETM